MDANDWKQLLEESSQHLAKALEQCGNDSLAVVKLNQLFDEYLELQEQLFSKIESNLPPGRPPAE